VQALGCFARQTEGLHYIRDRLLRSHAAAGVTPDFDRVDRVPTVLFVIGQAAAQEYPCANGRQRKGMKWSNLGGCECPTRVGQADTPAPTAPRPHSDDSAKNGHRCSPRLHEASTLAEEVYRGSYHSLNTG
jgi:hypothetical protein